MAAAAVAVPMLTGCMETPIPTSGVIATQLEGNPAATEAAVWGIPGRLNVITVNTKNHFDAGYPSIMHIRDVMTDDMAVDSHGKYDWYSSWSGVEAVGARWSTSQTIWNYFYEQINTCNNCIAVIDINTPNAQLKAFLASALAFRAMMYTDLACMYEVLPSDLFPDCKSDDGFDIKGLTACIVTETTTEEESRNNPRASHDDMVKFIMGDLTNARNLYENGAAATGTKNLPDLATIYGLIARVYLWDASYQAEINEDETLAATQYANAAEYARMAIDKSGAHPLTESEWHDKTKGFNDSSFSSWMFAGQYSKEDDVVQAGGIRSWTSFNSNEQSFGYAGSECGAYTNIGASFYERMNDRDFRKLSYVAPEGGALKGREPFLDAEFAEEYLTHPYIAIKFRPGEGNMNEYVTGCTVAYPLMRVEEMYFLEAEAVAHTNAAKGNQLLKDFMQTYRYKQYKNNVSDVDGVVEEIIFQKRMELWGEGRNFFDVKRLGYNIVRSYEGTNFDVTATTFNTNGRPSWMNFCIVQQEINNNMGVKHTNTPSPDGLYKPIS